MKITPGIVYEENLLWIPYQAQHTEGHAWLKVLGMDHESGAAAALIKYEAGYKAPKAATEVYSDSLYIQGELVDGSKVCRNMTYEYRPPGNTYGPTEAKQETVKFIITGGKGEKCSKEPIFIQNVDDGDWDSHPYYPYKEYVLSRTLRQDKDANCSIGYNVFQNVALTYPNKTMVHDVVEEAFCVEGGNMDYYGDVETWVKWRRGAYFHRPPFLGRHGHSLKTELPFKVFIKFHSLKLAEPHDIKEGISSSFVE